VLSNNHIPIFHSAHSDFIYCLWNNAMISGIKLNFRHSENPSQFVNNGLNNKIIIRIPTPNETVPIKAEIIPTIPLHSSFSTWTEKAQRLARKPLGRLCKIRFIILKPPLKNVPTKTLAEGQFGCNRGLGGHQFHLFFPVI
jgi:hypothetical protein